MDRYTALLTSPPPPPATHTSDRADFWLTIKLGAQTLYWYHRYNCASDTIQCSEWRLQCNYYNYLGLLFVKSQGILYYIIYTSLSDTSHMSQSHLVLSIQNVVRHRLHAWCLELESVRLSMGYTSIINYEAGGLVNLTEQQENFL